VIEKETEQIGAASCEDTKTHIKLIIDGPDNDKPRLAIEAIKEAREPYDLIITNNFYKQKGADQILEFILTQEAEKRCPVIVGISLPNPFSEETKKRLMSLGARSYVASVPTLLKEMYSVLAPAGDTF